MMQNLPIHDENFKLHDRLKNDTFFIKTLDLCDVLLMNDTRYPWLILVPRLVDCEEFFHLTQKQQQSLMAEITLVSERLNQLFTPTKINVGMLGNIVRQLHVHIIARFQNDAAWPGPVWGIGKAEPYQQPETIIKKIQHILDA